MTRGELEGLILEAARLLDGNKHGRSDNDALARLLKMATLAQEAAHWKARAEYAEKLVGIHNASER